jgi:hypothetical protein
MGNNICAAVTQSIQNCWNGVAHKIYSAQEAVCGLCGTDNKVYMLLIVGRVLQASALVAAVVSTACIVLAGPLALIGTISSLALGVLGTYIAINPQEVNDMLQMARPFVPGQPIGLYNPDANCWVNASLQLVSNFPSYAPRLSNFPILAQYLDRYAAAGQNHQKIASQINTQEIRQFLSTATNGQIAPSGVEEDAAVFFDFLFQGVNAQYHLDQVTDGGAPIVRLEPMIQINLLQDPMPASFPGLQQLFNEFFDYQTTSGQHIQVRFPRPPNELLIQERRFYQTGTQSGGNLQFGKINHPIELPERLTLQNQFTSSNEGAEYVLDGVLVHRGFTPDSGHYVTYLKRGNTWWYCSDTYVYEVPVSQVLEEAKYSYITHWSKVSR